VVYWNIYLPGMGYSLPVTTFSEDELNHIQSTPIRAILPAMGYNRNMPKAVVFGPREYGGIGLRHLYIEEGSQQTATFMRHYRHGGRIGRALLIGLQWFQLINGTSYDSFEQPNRLLPHAVGSWFISIRQFLTASGFGLKFTKPLYDVSTRRTHDKVLMDDVLRIVKTPTKIQQINKVQSTALPQGGMPLRNMHRQWT
jgi:hypothetical protein